MAEQSFWHDPGLTPGQRWKNWWWYHWKHALVGLVAAAVLFTIVWDHVTKVEPDCTVALVTGFLPGDREVASLKAQLERWSPDSNGDGKVLVGVRPSHMVLAKQPGNTLSATVEVSEMMGSEVHFHASAEGRDVVVIVPTMDATGTHIDSFHAGDKLNLTFSGNVCHVFSQDGRNLEF